MQSEVFSLYFIDTFAKVNVVLVLVCLFFKFYHSSLSTNSRFLDYKHIST